jgi:hypothetical protein
MVSEYFGEYAVPSFNGNGSISGLPYTAAATNGCFFLILEQPVGGVIGQASSRQPQAGPTPNAFGDGEPNESGLLGEVILDEGPITSLTISNLTPTSGSGSFSFTDSAANTVSGTITITGSQTIVGSPAESIRRFQGPGMRQ